MIQENYEKELQCQEVNYCDSFELVIGNRNEQQMAPGESLEEHWIGHLMSI